jgi:CSLREA domain-containing protein
VILAITLVALLTVAGGDAATTHGAAFPVDSTSDAVDANPGDGACATVASTCTLRAAIQEANALPGPDTITLPAGTYALTIPGRAEDAAATGDLDITDDVVITGAGRDATVIDGGGLDRVFHSRLFFHSELSVEISALTIRNGDAQFALGAGSSAASGGGVHNGDGVNLKISDAAILDNHATSFGGGIYNGASILGTSLTLDKVTVAENAVGGPTTPGATTGGEGGGISGGGQTTLIDSSIVNNSAENGSVGGIAAGGKLNLIRTTVSDNAAGAVAGGIGTRSGYYTIDGSTISRNKVGSGAGGIGGGGTLTVANSTIADNEAAFGEGGGVRYIGGAEGVVDLRIMGSAITGNIAAFEGGGIYTWTAAMVSITNSTISGNTAGAAGPDFEDRALGGGIFVLVGDVELQNATVANNAAPAGGGVHNNAGNGTNGSLRLGNSLIAQNQGSNCVGEIVSSGHNLEDATSCGLSASGDISGVPARLAPLADNGGSTQTHALLQDSPAIDGGANAGCPALDQRKYHRPTDGDGNGTAFCDIGAYEAHGQQFDAVFGDTHCDGAITTVDALKTLLSVTGKAGSACGPNSVGPVAGDPVLLHFWSVFGWGDVNCDGGVDAVDALALMRHVSGLPPLKQVEPCPEIATPVPLGVEPPGKWRSR